MQQPAAVTAGPVLSFAAGTDKQVHKAVLIEIPRRHASGENADVRKTFRRCEGAFAVIEVEPGTLLFGVGQELIRAANDTEIEVFVRVGIKKNGPAVFTIPVFAKGLRPLAGESSFAVSEPQLRQFTGASPEENIRPAIAVHITPCHARSQLTVAVREQRMAFEIGLPAGVLYLQSGEDIALFEQRRRLGVRSARRQFCRTLHRQQLIGLHATQDLNSAVLARPADGQFLDLRLPPETKVQHGFIVRMVSGLGT